MDQQTPVRRMDDNSVARPVNAATSHANHGAVAKQRGHAIAADAQTDWLFRRQLSQGLGDGG
jgi:hypothetical protein